MNTVEIRNLAISITLLVMGLLLWWFGVLS